jgi:hypothetical protein
MPPEQAHGMRRRRTRRHQAARADDAFLNRIDDRGVDCVIHPEVVCVDDEHSGIGNKSQQLTGQALACREPGPSGAVVHVLQYPEPVHRFPQAT